MILIGYVFFDIRSGHKIFPFYHIKVITESGSVQAQDIGERAVCRKTALILRSLNCLRE